MRTPTIDRTNSTHRRKNILTGEWILVSPQLATRPWRGEVAAPNPVTLPPYDPACYLCPGNTRANGIRNPHFDSTFAFTNDFPALLPGTHPTTVNRKGLLVAKTENGICRVVNFSPRHNLTLAQLEEADIGKVVETWQREYRMLADNPKIRYITIFENKGSMMGNSNPHPHCQIWAQETIPMEPMKELRQLRLFYKANRRGLLGTYLDLELQCKERLVYQNRSFVIVVPFWAVWPFGTILIPRRKFANILEFTSGEAKDFANALSTMTRKYDSLFATSCPYSAGMHQAPTNGRRYPECHFHMHFYPPLLRSASIKKYMVGYEMLAEPQRDITPEASAEALAKLPATRLSPVQSQEPTLNQVNHNEHIREFQN